MRTLYIVPPDGSGEGVYSLISDAGELLASHYCSNASFALGDLESRRPERQEKFRNQFGEYRVTWLGSDGTSLDELLARAQQKS